MKRILSRNYLLIPLIAGLAAQPALANPNGFSFNVSGTTDAGNEVQASGDVIFDLTTDTASVNLFTASPYPSDLVAFYILKPLASEEGDRSTPTAMNGIDDWTLAEEADNQMSNLLDDNSLLDSFFGAEADNDGQDGIAHTDPTSLFTFQFDDDLSESDWLAYFGENQTPHVMLRWQSVGEDGEDSAKFSGGLDAPGTITPVPEPSQIAALSMAGLVGLLFIRRRIKAKRTAKS